MYFCSGVRRITSDDHTDCPNTVTSSLKPRDQSLPPDQSSVKERQSTLEIGHQLTGMLMRPCAGGALKGAPLLMVTLPRRFSISGSRAMSTRKLSYLPFTSSTGLPMSLAISDHCSWVISEMAFLTSSVLFPM